jgi:excisionase family DNA binding protein
MTTSIRTPQTPDDRLVYTVAEAGELLGISRAFAYELVARGELPVICLGCRRLVPNRPPGLVGPDPGRGPGRTTPRLSPGALHRQVGGPRRVLLPAHRRRLSGNLGRRVTFDTGATRSKHDMTRSAVRVGPALLRRRICRRTSLNLLLLHAPANRDLVASNKGRSVAGQVQDRSDNLRRLGHTLLERP